MTLRIYVWEGRGISAAYHDDGTLVILAESAEQARAFARQARADRRAEEAAWERERDELAERAGFAQSNGTIRAGFWRREDAAALWERIPSGSVWDGEDGAIDREPDRVIECESPTWVAFNGGGYD